MPRAATAVAEPPAPAAPPVNLATLAANVAADVTRERQREAAQNEQERAHFYLAILMRDKPDAHDADRLRGLIEDGVVTAEQVAADVALIAEARTWHEHHQHRAERREALAVARTAQQELKRRHEAEVKESNHKVWHLESEMSLAHEAAQRLILMARRRPSFFEAGPDGAMRLRVPAAATT